MTTEESQTKTDIRKLLSHRGAFWSNVAGGPYSKPGDPDIIACYHGMFIGIEAKTYRGKQSEIQKVRERQIRDAGGIYMIARTVADVEEFLDDLDRIEQKEERK